MRFLLICVLATIFAAMPTFAQRGGGRAGGRPGGFRGNGNAPNTFVTVASAAPAAPAATQGTGAAGGGNANNAPAAGGGAATVQASLIPPFGITAGIKATDGTANCVGDNKINIP